MLLYIFFQYLFVLIIILLLGVSIGIVGFVYAANVNSFVSNDVKESIFQSINLDSIIRVDSIQQTVRFNSLPK